MSQPLNSKFVEAGIGNTPHETLSCSFSFCKMAAPACSLASLSGKFPAKLYPAHSQPPARAWLTSRKVVALGWAATVAARSVSRVSKVARNGGKHDEMETALASLHPQLAAAVRQAVSNMPKAEILLIGSKEEIGGVKGVPLEEAKTEPRSLRELPHDCYDLIVEVQSEELQSRSWEAVQNRFYPLGGHSFSLANDFIINLASICKVLRNGGKFLFLSVAKSQEEVLPFSFLKLPHLKWQIDIETSTGDGSDAAVSIVCCTLSEDATAESLKLTPRIIAEQCTDEISRRRYFEALKPFLKREDGKSPRILDYGCGDGSLMSWVLESLPQTTPEITLVEANPELAARASSKLPGAKVLHHEGEPWPFADLQFDVVVLAFVFHHVDEPLLAEAQRVAHKILILEDLPDEAASLEAKRLAWHVTEEHFRPFGQDPKDYIAGVLPRERWTEVFQEAGLEILSSKIIEPSLRYPVPHILFELAKK